MEGDCREGLVPFPFLRIFLYALFTNEPVFLFHDAQSFSVIALSGDLAIFCCSHVFCVYTVKIVITCFYNIHIKHVVKGLAPSILALYNSVYREKSFRLYL